MGKIGQAEDSKMASMTMTGQTMSSKAASMIMTEQAEN